MANEAEAERTVRACLAALEAHDSALLRPFLTDDVVYHNVPLEPSVGLDATLNVQTRQGDPELADRDPGCLRQG